MHLRILCIILALSMVDSICCNSICVFLAASSALSRSTTDNDIDASTEAYSFDLTSEESNDFTDDAKRFNHPMPTKYDRNCWFSPLGCLYPKGVDVSTFSGSNVESKHKKLRHKKRRRAFIEN
ncbi:unnamed protein product, partial [Mesorhabditis spiculigera]